MAFLHDFCHLENICNNLSGIAQVISLRQEAYLQ